MQLPRVWQAASKSCDSGASCHLTRQEAGSQGAKMEGKYCRWMEEVGGSPLLRLGIERDQASNALTSCLTTHNFCLMTTMGIAGIAIGIM